MKKIFLKVNGVWRQFIVESDYVLLDLLRKDLRLTGAKQSCDRKGQCGACTVIVNGKAVRSCVTPLSSVEGKEITTIEGLLSDLGHFLQLAWIDENVPQCGYCQTGQIMTAAVLLRENPSPTEDDIDRAMNGNICRCGTYQRIRRAIHLAAAMKQGGGK